VCLKYTAPNFIDPKLLDPSHVFKEVADPGLQTVDVLHKKYDKLNKRHRTGYDESLGMTLRSSKSVSEFIESSDPVRMLTDVNELIFTDSCERYKTHAQMTPELMECFKDLRVLGKIDFKKMLKWRQNVRKEDEKRALDEKRAVDGDDSESVGQKPSKRFN
jgi:AdoMet-dependent rRNA methyltransferase SPB1